MAFYCSFHTVFTILTQSVDDAYWVPFTSTHPYFSAFAHGAGPNSSCDHRFGDIMALQETFGEC